MKTKTPAQKQAIERRPKLRPATRRMIAASLLYWDPKRQRFVIARRAGGAVKKTSVRCRGLTGKALQSAEAHARSQAKRLHAWPADKLAKFKW